MSILYSATSFTKSKRLNIDDLKMKARISFHGNEDQERETLRTDSSSGPPVAIRVVASVSTFFKLRLQI